MSVLIKDMEMPKDGAFVEVLIWSDGHVTQTGDSYFAEDGRAYYRPCDWKYFSAVPVPPHGRLIDADELLERFEKEEKAADEHGRDFSFSFKSGGENCTEWWPVQQMLMDAPTIIPAEE